MQESFPCIEELKDLDIRALGENRFDSPFIKRSRRFTEDDSRVLVYSNIRDAHECEQCGRTPPAFEEAGPREKLFFDGKKSVAGIVTCGGLCPGLNDVIRTIVMELYWEYGVTRILGFRHGYEGLSSNRRKEPMTLSPDAVQDIQHQGGTILGTSRGPQDVDDMIDTLRKFKVNMLFVIGGDGTFTGAHELAVRIRELGLKIAVVGLPKTIDNDIYCSERTFGFGTAVEEGRKAIQSAHHEAKAAWNGIGLVKLMGRDSGFIAVHSTLANSDVNFCLIPEVPFTLEGEGGLFARLEDRLKRRQHAVIVVAEGAGQDLIAGEREKDPSGNAIYKDVGLFLKYKIKAHFRDQGIAMTLKYIDPSYMIRSIAANAEDSGFCILLGQNAVHAAMAGKTDMFVGYWNHHFTNVPLEVAVGKWKAVDPLGEYWQSVVSMTD